MGQAPNQAWGALVTATGQQVNAILMDRVSEVPQSRTGK
jgi:hypothetical protein